MRRMKQSATLTCLFVLLSLATQVSSNATAEERPGGVSASGTHTHPRSIGAGSIPSRFATGAPSRSSSRLGTWPFG
jgi:hypothetical protein